MKSAILLCILLLLSCNDNPTNNEDVIIEDDTTQTNDYSNLEIPEILSNQEIISHKAYSLSYNEEHEQSNWVAYQLLSSELIENFERGNDYREDPLVLTGTANDDDYSGSGYDRGHLAPAEDFSWDSVAMSESFYYSNMSPQDPSFNRGKWKALENDVRRWAIEFDSVWVVTGCIFDNPIGTIGENNVTIPSYFYKAIMIPNYECIGFIMPNERLSDEPENFVITIDSLESVIGYDLFYKLDDQIESEKESSFNYGVFYE